MVKAGRLYIPLDVNWYDEWGYAVSNDAALLWVIAIGLAKRIGSDVLPLDQLRRAAPPKMTDAEYDTAVAELQQCPIAPISPHDTPMELGVELGVVLHGFWGWNAASDAVETGSFGGHVRWHVKTRSPSSKCQFCIDIGAIGPSIDPNSYRVEKSRVYKTSTADGQQQPPNEFEDDFNECWKIYPRKLSRLEAMDKYVAQRRKGVSHSDLLAATEHFAESMRLGERSKDYIMHGSTFFGTHDRWADYLLAPIIPDKGSSGTNKAMGRVNRSRLDVALGDIAAYRDIGEDESANELQKQVDNGDFDD